MAILPSLRSFSPSVGLWTFRANPAVAQVRLLWRDPSQLARPIEVHGTAAVGAMAGWVPDDSTLLGVVSDGRFVHSQLGPESTRWCYAIVPVGGDRARDGASLSVATTTSVTRVGAPVAAVGQFNGNCAGLALAPNGFVHYLARFPQDVDFRFGLDDAAVRWPYLQPGPDDAWAGRRSHRFRLRFDLDREPRTDLDLALWLVDRHPTRPGSATIAINGVRDEPVLFSADTTRPGADPSAVPGRGAGPMCIERPLARELLVAGENVIDIDKDLGSWIVYDALGVFARHSPGLRLSVG